MWFAFSAVGVRVTLRTFPNQWAPFTYYSKPFLFNSSVDCNELSNATKPLKFIGNLLSKMLVRLNFKLAIIGKEIYCFCWLVGLLVELQSYFPALCAGQCISLILCKEEVDWTHFVLTFERIRKTYKVLRLRCNVIFMTLISSQDT